MGRRWHRSEEEEEKEEEEEEEEEEDEEEEYVDIESTCRKGFLIERERRDLFLGFEE